MSVVLYITAALVLPLAVYLFMSLMAAAARIWRGGASEALEFDRAGVGWRSLWRANVRRQDSGSLISTRAGIRMRSGAGGLKVGETRTIAKDMF
jgi:hypothetical protein